ncbi:MAG TPA: FUSC family protein [Pseudonocardiaceae bacterium]|nr:FUSC family protein [Pseudonocardiaceae bacterium]
MTALGHHRAKGDIAVPGWLGEAVDRIVASDPGLARLRMAAAASAAMGSALGVEFVYAAATHAAPTAALIAMLLGAVVALMGSMALNGPGGPAWKIRTAVFFPVAVGAGLVCGVAVAARTDLMLGIFVAVMFVAVFVRRFGPAFFFYGFMGWMGYFFASFLHATTAMLPGLLIDVCIGTVWVLLLSLTVLRIHPTRTLLRAVNAFRARSRSIARACADLLTATGEQRRRRALRRLRAGQARLVEAALIVEAWSGESGALPGDGSATRLRRALLEAHHTLDRLVAASETIAATPECADLARSAARVADALARRDDVTANRVAHAMAEAAEDAAAPGWLPARHFATAALEYVGLIRLADIHGADRDGREFAAVVALAMGNLPGSPAAAGDVPARGGRWNPLARLDLVGRQAVQVAVAGGLAILAGRELSQTRYYWAVLAAFIMFTGTATRSETVIKGANRVLGTLGGLFASVWLAELTAGHTAAVVVAIVASMFCGLYLLPVSYAYMIFFLTVMLGQLYSVLHEFSTGLLVLRLEETAIGAAVGLVVAMAVVPLSTRDTVRAARDSLVTAFADLLGAVADRASGAAPTADLDALSRDVDNRYRQLRLVARPLTRPLLLGNSPPRTRHRLVLYAALAAHARALAVTRGRPPSSGPGLAQACRALATAASRIAAGPVGQPASDAAGPLADADAALFAITPAVPGARATDPVLHTLIHLLDVLRELAGMPVRPGEATPAAVGRVTGSVYGPDAVGPLPDMTLAVIDAAGRVVARAMTNRCGRYDIPDLPAGTYTLVATGHPPATGRIRLTRGRDDSVNLVLGRRPDH